MIEDSQLEFNQATSKDIGYITDKTLSLHYFETEKSKSSLPVKNSFPEEVTKWISDEIELDNSLIFKVLYQKEDIGFAFLKIHSLPNQFSKFSRFGLIQSIWIEPKFRNNSIGSKVVKFIESIFVEQSIPYYEVSFENSNKTAENFWSKCGLIPSSTTARKFLD